MGNIRFFNIPGITKMIKDVKSEDNPPRSNFDNKRSHKVWKLVKKSNILESLRLVDSTIVT